MITLLVQLNVVIVLAISFMLLRLVGRFGFAPLASWRAAATGALALLFVVTGISHFTGLKYDLAAMVPAPLPNGLWLISLTGVLELAGAIGLLIPRTRRLAAIGLVLLLIGMFPANVNAALNGIPLGGSLPTPLWLRLPEQLLYLGLLWWTAARAQPTPRTAARLAPDSRNLPAKAG